MGKITEVIKKQWSNDVDMELIGRCIDCVLKDFGSRIEALEKTIKCVDALIPPDTLEKEEDRTGIGRTGQPEDPISTDKFGKPPGGLEQGDVLLGHCGSIVRFGIFHHCDGKEIWAHWGSLDTSLTIKMDKALGYWDSQEVTFLFRPKAK